MSTRYASRDDRAGSIPPEPRVTFGVLMAATALLPFVAGRYFTPEIAGKLLVATIPLLLIAVFRTSITSYSVFEPADRRR